MFKTLAQVQKDLQTLANTKGKNGYEKASKAYLEAVTLVEDDGVTPIEALPEIEVKFADPVVVEKAAPVADSNEQFRKIVREELASVRGTPNRSKGLSITVEDPTRGRAAPRGRVKHMSTPQLAHDFGMSIAASLFGNERAKQYCRDNGIQIRGAKWNGDELVLKAANEGTNTAGGFLVDGEHENELVRLTEQYGIFAQNAQSKPMNSDTLSVKRQTGYHTAYPVGEAVAGTESSAAFDRMLLVAKKWMVLDTASSEFSEDSAVAFGDVWAFDVARAFAYAQDNAGFNGDGTGTYNNIVGLRSAFLNLNATLANIAGLYDSTAANWAAVTLAQIQAWLAKLPAYADGPNCKIFCSKAFYHNVLERLMQATGGTSMFDVSTGLNTHMFMGTPVVFSQVMPMSETANTIDAFYGDLSMSSYFGNRRGTTIATSESALNAFEQDEIAWRATQRWDILNANIGNASSTATLQVPGPIVAFVGS